MNYQKTAVLKQEEVLFSDLKLYLVGVVFTTLSIVLPMVFHQFGLAGKIFLPIYFFTLVGGYKFGWRAGLFMGFFAPVISFYLSGMPFLIILPFVLFKNSLLGVVAGLIARRSKLGRFLKVIIIVALYQTIGMAFTYFLTGSSKMATVDFILGYPGLLLQIFGGFAVLSVLGEGEGKK